MFNNKGFITVRALGIIIVIIVVVAAVGFGIWYVTRPPEKVTLRFLDIETPFSWGIREMWRNEETEFEKEHPNVDVEFEFTTEADIKPKASADFAAHTGIYDIVGLLFWYTEDWAGPGFLEPLDEYMENSSEGFCGMDSFIEPVNETFLYNGHVYALPQFTQTGMLYINRELFEKYDPVNPETPEIEYPNTMEEVEIAAKALTNDTDGDGEIDQYGFTSRGKPDSEGFYTMNGWMHAYAGRMFADNMSVRVLEPEYVDAMKQYVRLLRDYGPPGQATFGWWEWKCAFEEGNIGMAYDDGHEAIMLIGTPAWNATDWTLAPLGPSGKRAQVWYSEGNCINADSENKDLAWEWLKWASSEETIEKLIRDYGAIEPIHKSFLTEPYYEEMYESLNLSRWYETRVAMLPYTRDVGYFPRITGYSEMVTSFAAQISSAIGGEISTEEALETAASAIIDVVEKRGLTEYWTITQGIE